MTDAPFLIAWYVKAAVPYIVTLMQPLPNGGSRPISGRILGEMHSRGALHHYRVSIGDGTILLAPPGWLHADSRNAVARAGLTVNRCYQDQAEDDPIPGPSGAKALLSKVSQ